VSTPIQHEIVEAVRKELEVTGRARKFVVVLVSRQQHAIRIQLRLSEGGARLDDRLEGGVLIWAHSASPILAISVDESTVYVHPANDPMQCIPPSEIF